MRTFLAALVGVAVLAVAVPASAHVGVSADNATQGGYSVLTFTVPNESDTAGTTKLTVQLPTDTPIAAVSIQPKPGWTWQATKEKLATPVTTDDGTLTEAVSTIVWWPTSAQNAIKPGEFDTFSISAGPLPKVDALTFKVLQAYSDGSVSKWIQTPAPGSDAEPEFPAPTLSLAAASDSGDHRASASSSAAPVAASSDGGDSGSDTGALVLSVIALVLAAGALGLAVVTRARAGRA